MFRLPGNLLGRRAPSSCSHPRPSLNLSIWTCLNTLNVFATCWMCLWSLTRTVHKLIDWRTTEVGLGKVLSRRWRIASNQFLLGPNADASTKLSADVSARHERDCKKVRKECFWSFLNHLWLQRCHLWQVQEATQTMINKHWCSADRSIFENSLRSKEQIPAGTAAGLPGRSGGANCPRLKQCYAAMPVGSWHEMWSNEERFQHF